MPELRMKSLLIAIFFASLIVVILTVFLTEKFSGTTIHLAGDSTMSVQLSSKRPGTGWGEPFASMVCSDVRVVNHAKNGRSTKSFLSEGLWGDLLSQLKTDDIVLMQFGHNDQKASNPELYANPWQLYKDNVERFVLDVQQHGAEPVLLTPIVRRVFDAQGALLKTHGDYPDVIRSLAAQLRVKLVDLNTLTYQLVSSLGPDMSKSLYLHLAAGVNDSYIEGIQDDTHLNSKGAITVARLTAVELRRLYPSLVCP